MRRQSLYLIFVVQSFSGKLLVTWNLALWRVRGLNKLKAIFRIEVCPCRNAKVYHFRMQSAGDFPWYI